MPTYEYACRECGHHFEVVQSFKDDPLTDCPTCSAAAALRKVFHPIGISFKGSGFYKTDSRPASTAASSSSAGGAGESSTTPAKSEPSKSDSGSSSSPSTTSSSTAAAS